MRYVTSIEQLAREEGIKQGILRKGREDVIEILEMRFGAVPTSLVESVRGINEQSLLKTLFRRAIAIGSLEEFEQFLEQVGLQE